MSAKTQAAVAIAFTRTFRFVADDTAKIFGHVRNVSVLETKCKNRGKSQVLCH